MKILAYISGFLICSLLLLSGMTDLRADEPEVVKETQIAINLDQDTLSTSSSVDTAIWAIPPIYSPQIYQFQLNADSISGATGGTCYLQVSTDLGGSDWATIETIVVNGVTTRTKVEGSLIRGALRCMCVAPSSTQLTVIRPDFESSSASGSISYQ